MATSRHLIGSRFWACVAVLASLGAGACSGTEGGSPGGSAGSGAGGHAGTAGTSGSSGSSGVGGRAGSTSGAGSAGDSGSGGSGGECERPDPAQPWIQAFQQDLVAKLAGEITLPGGERLPNRQTASNRALTQEFLLAAFDGFGLKGEVHAYATGKNIYAELVATDGSSETVVFGAHFDSAPNCPGANDNATGVAAVLAAARYLQSVSCRSKTLLFVLFDEEELGLVGSNAFAKKLRDEGRNVHSVHTIDQMGWDADGDRRIEVELPDQGLRELYVAGAAHFLWSDPEAAIQQTDVSSTDHAAFRPAFAAVGLTEEFKNGDTTPHIHKPSDTYATVDFSYLERSTVLIHHVLADLVALEALFAHGLPRPRTIPRSPDEIDTRSRHPRHARAGEWRHPVNYAALPVASDAARWIVRG